MAAIGGTPAPTLASLSAQIATLQEAVKNAQNQALTATSAAERAQNTANAANTTATGVAANVSPTPASPPVSQFDNPENINKNIKIASSNLFIDQTAPSSSQIADMLFQSFPVTELITNTSNFSLLGGGTNDVISNIKEISDKFSSYSLSRLPDLTTSNSFKLSSFLPTTGTGPNGATVYFDTNNQYIYIEVDNINNKELVEYQIVSQSTVLDATI